MNVVATREDILACFRLLLGRDPNPEEIPGHLALAGSPLAQVVGSYLHSLEFRNRGLMTPNGEAELVRLDRFVIYVDSNDVLIAPSIRAGYEPELTKAFVNELQSTKGGVIDIGANCGYFSLLASSFARTVYAIEPLQQNVRLLFASRRANNFEQMHIIAAAASDRMRTLAIGAAYTDGIVGSTPDEVTASLAADYVAGVRVDECIPEDAAISIIKIDVEGHEYQALSGARKTIERNRPVIFSEFSPAALQSNSHRSGREYLELLQGLGYGVSVVGEPSVATPDAIVGRCAGTDHIDIVARANQQ
jgi:FkbM family methyltransferase